MVFTAAVANLIPGVMSLSVLGRSTQMIPRNSFWGNGKKKANGKKMIGGFANIMMGVPMIGIVSGQVAAL